MRNERLSRVWKHPLGRFSIALIGLFMLVSTLGYLIVPDPSPSANTMHLALANAPMGTEMKVLRITDPTMNVSTGFFERWFFGDPTRTREYLIEELRPSEKQIDYKEYLGVGVISEDWESIQLAENETYEVVDRTYWLGTDKYGRDLLSRLILGGRVSIAVGFISVLISLLIGIPLGALAGYYGGWIDKSVMWLVNVVWSVPTLLMVIALTFVLGKGFWQVFVAVGLTMWVEVARVVRGQVMGIRQMEYVEAAKVLGYSSTRIIAKHVLPNALAPVIVISAANFASAILMESGLSFLGIGAQPPIPSWGGIIRDHYAYIITGEAHLSLLPGLCIMLLVLSFMTLGNTLRDALDVRAS
ncbi:ABC transporter permease [Phaeocystidibacter luteus]|uniref:ABC transporter permease n=2 Tax=Phaeocystidibacter luteus TaxID=911197 RepID=A0A6N6RIJ2_9FLAO|nr:ABC transporter permease [Phaeocystidibacter luteus]